MGKIGENIRKNLGLLEDKPEEEVIEEKEAEVEIPKDLSSSKLTSFGIKTEVDKDGNTLYTCVQVIVKDGKLEVNDLSPHKRKGKGLVLEDWKLNAGKFVLRRDEW